MRQLRTASWMDPVWKLLSSQRDYGGWSWWQLYYRAAEGCGPKGVTPSIISTNETQKICLSLRPPVTDRQTSEGTSEDTKVPQSSSRVHSHINKFPQISQRLQLNCCCSLNHDPPTKHDCPWLEQNICSSSRCCSSCSGLTCFAYSSRDMSTKKDTIVNQLIWLLYFF